MTVAEQTKAAATIHAKTLTDAFAPLGVEHSEAWAWENYERVVRHLTETFGAKKLIEIGGGRDPLFGREALANMGAELTVNDISETELAELPIFFFNDSAATEIYTLSLHDALPI